VDEPFHDLENNRFRMEEPRSHGSNTEYAFWLYTAEQDLIDLVREMGCVASIQEDPNGRLLVEISDEHDADEAWHWVRTELEMEINSVKLDKIWQDAIWLL